MPTHAFTRRGVLLLAAGERVTSRAQLRRLFLEDVLFSDDPPARVCAAIEVRYQRLSYRPAPWVQLPAQPVVPEPALSDAQIPTSLAEELHSAREVRAATMRQVGRVAERVRAGQPIDTPAVRRAVRHVIASVGRNKYALASLVQMKHADDYLYTHSVNTCTLAVIVAGACGLADQAEEIALGALVHDIGKLKLPAGVLEHPGPLSAEDWDLIRGHPRLGVEALQSSPEFGPVACQAVVQHHERADGSGYPAGLRGEEVSLAARIVALADVYDAMTSARSYHLPMQPADAVRTILAQAGQAFDHELDHAFVRSVGTYPAGCLVRLNTGELAIVQAVNPEAYRRPLVLVITTPWGDPLPAAEPLDLASSAPSAAKRDIVAAEEAADLGIDVNSYLAAASEPQGEVVPPPLPSWDVRA